MPCPIDVMDLVGKKWTFALLEEINISGNNGFNFLARKMKMSSKVLAERLKELENLGIVVREDADMHTKYSLTEKGSSLQSILHSLKVWHSSKCAETLCSECVTSALASKSYVRD